MLVMQLPMNTSSTLSPMTSDRSRASSGSLGAHTIGSLMSSMLIVIVQKYSASGSAFKSVGSASHASIPATRRSIVLRSPYPASIIHFSMTTLDSRYSRIGASSREIVHPAALRSADASDNSNACSHFRCSKPSISKIRPLNTFFLFCLSTVRWPSWIARYGIACTRSLRVIPGCIVPVNLTFTDSGMSNGMTPVAAPNATSPLPAGKEMPIGNRVCESPPVPTVSGKSMRFSQL
mmetsp:Transcript_11567/g.38248  ORF Transcript_11567/g.38248 Transcript_11567/m.38248 type:complete len:235 (+) Transcript_11567:610-1314(+)